MRAAVAVTVPFLALFMGCAAGPYQVGATADQPPGWTDKTSFGKGGKRYYVGRSNGAVSTDDGYELARADALRTLVQEIGVTVSETSKAFQQERNGEFSYDVQLQVAARSEPVKLRNMAVVDRYQETWQRGGTQYDSWVLVTVPAAEVARARRTVAGRVLLVWECASQPDGACAGALRDAVQAALSKAGRPLVNKVVAGPAPSDPAALGIERGAAYVLTVKLSGEFSSEVGGEFFATARGSAKLLDTGEGKVVETLDTGAVKGGHFSQKKAVEAALKKATGELVHLLETRLVKEK